MSASHRLSHMLAMLFSLANLIAITSRAFGDEASRISAQPDFRAVQVPLFLDDDDKPASAPSGPDRYFFNLLDHSSRYGKDFFHDPLFGPEFDRERQIEADYFHGEGDGQRDDSIYGAFQWNVIGQLMVAGQVTWRNEKVNVGMNSSARSTAHGLDSVDLAVYHPVVQFVSADGTIDYTALGRLDIGLPTRTRVSGGDVLLSPTLGQLLRLGDHWSIQAWTGPQITIAPRQHNSLIYGTSIGYVLPHEQLPLPAVDRLIPIIELDGQAPFSTGSQDLFYGAIGFCINFDEVGHATPKFQFGCQFPLDAGARRQEQWAILSEVLVEF